MRRTLLVPLSAAVLTGCSLLGPDAARIRLCVDGTCGERWSGGPADPFLRMGIRLPDDVRASTVPVRLTVTSVRSGDTVVEDSARARLTDQHPNGTACPPTVWTATFRAHPDKGLASTAGMSLQG
jgi:hypothetical protein